MTVMQNEITPFSMTVSPDILGRLMPFFLHVAGSGHIRTYGPSLQKIRPGQPLKGLRFLEVVQVIRPRNICCMRDFDGQDSWSIRCVFRQGKPQKLKGQIVQLDQEQGYLVNLSPGISFDLMAAYDLKSKDFAPTDQTVDMLYLMKVQSALLGESKNLNNRLQGAKLMAEEQAYTDVLTGLNNRRALAGLLRRLLHHPEAAKFSLMHLDLDSFKAVNDTLGHAAGDHVLQEVAKALLNETRSMDMVTRVGGDEFIIVFPDCTEPKLLSAIADRIVKRLSQPIAYGQDLCRIGVSIGINRTSLYDRPEAEQMIQDADAALYLAKTAGKGQKVFFDPALDKDAKTKSD